MQRKRLCILIEGDGDKELFVRILKPILDRKYAVVLWKYAEKKNEEINEYLNNEKYKQNADYIFVTDKDKSPCVSEKKREKQKELNSLDDPSRIMIVIKEIDSWYLAGVKDEKWREYGYEPPVTTDKMDKGDIEKIRRKKSMSRIDFLQEILDNFDNIEIAKQRNISFKYFIDKYCP
jgi:hypothetical protein